MLGIKLKEVGVLRQMVEERNDNLFGLFEQIEKTSGRNAKLEILASATLRQRNLLQWALDPFMQFHITSWGKLPAVYGKFADDNEAYLEFNKLIHYAMQTNRSSALVTAVSRFFVRCNELQAKWFSRVLTKDLKFGLQEKSINSVFDKLIPSHSVMLAEKAEPDLSNVVFNIEHGKKVTWVERKYDGFRITVVYRMNGVVDILTRSGKDIPNTEFVKRLSSEACTEAFKGLVLDGEGYCHSLPFEKLSSLLRTDDAKLPNDFQFVVFDIISEEEFDFQLGHPDKNFSQRLDFREELIGGFSEYLESENAFSWLVSAYGEYCHSTEEIQAFYEKAIEDGFEGAMVKNLNGLYEFKRSKNILKVKPIDFIDAVIIGYYEGEGQIKGKLGGFTCELESGEFIRVGGGYKLWQREDFWRDKEALIGRAIEIKFTQMTDKGKLRHGNFRSLRTDK